MRHIEAILCVTVLALMPALTAEAGAAQEPEAAAVRAVIEESYVRGIHNERDPELIRKGFHPSFVMLIRTEEGTRSLPIGEWIASIEKGKKEDPSPARQPVTSEIPMVDIAGNAAVARIEIYRGTKHLFTDYMSLYRFEDGWKIVGKIFHRYE